MQEKRTSKAECISLVVSESGMIPQFITSEEESLMGIEASENRVKCIVAVVRTGIVSHRQESNRLLIAKCAVTFWSIRKKM